jgi:FtsP/CotA-like multicopper oxidase with cupredoxin domain
MFRLKHRLNELALNAFRNRQEIVKEGLTRRELFKLGLLTSTGWLVAKSGLSSRAHAQFGGGGGGGSTSSPQTRAFIEPLPRPPINVPQAALTPAPTAAPNSAAGEGRARAHQAFTSQPPQLLYAVTQKDGLLSVSPDLPPQRLWGFAIGTPEQNQPITVPGPTYVARYGQPVLVRNFNRLPADNGGFGINSASTHLHNGHTPSESDGNPTDFFAAGQFYDHHYPNVLAGFASTHAPNGDINEAMGSLWYHDHRLDFTAQNTYKGLVGTYHLFNQFDTGDETTGFRLPSFPDFDVYLTINDRKFDPQSGALAFDLFTIDGVLGDKFLVNGKIQPFFQVHPRRYRLRLLNTGPSRFLQFFLTDPASPNTANSFYQISNDGNLLPAPVLVNSVRLSVAERADIIVDFSRFAGKSIFLENRLQQLEGQGPTGTVLGAGQGNNVMRIDVVLPPVADNSADPATQRFYSLPSTALTPLVTRTFSFDRRANWAINGQVFQDTPRFRVKRNTVEKWVVTNNSFGWQHPVHIHFEEFQTLTINGRAVSNSPLVNSGRKDVLRLEFNQTAELLFRFRDFVGKYPMHCHNVVHEDHAMMLRFDIDDVGDRNTRP